MPTRRDGCATTAEPLTSPAEPACHPPHYQCTTPRYDILIAFHRASPLRNKFRDFATSKKCAAVSTGPTSQEPHKNRHPPSR
ncbi:hypothetical protein HPB48_005459 [Haemaphysalis longicornis]|uniref:Uncharacterized protein n=1 Tax=Haemaphysalis longicornis TaxID=44386 RepID=A0A9J6H3Z1_HAELO|nr:hypothetical protein HPB48_005459 [Haemaphysalis longicornis]